MPFRPDPRNASLLLGRARRVLGLSQRELANALGVARRTIARWEAGNTNIDVPEIQQLATLVLPADASLAAQLVAETGTTLEALGLVPAAAAPSPAEMVPAPAIVAHPVAPLASAPAAPPARSYPPVDLTIDSVLYVAVKALRDAGSREPEAVVRAVLCAAVSRARGLGLTLDEVESALAGVARA